MSMPFYFFVPSVIAASITASNLTVEYSGLDKPAYVDTSVMNPYGFNDPVIGALFLLAALAFLLSLVDDRRHASGRQTNNHRQQYGFTGCLCLGVLAVYAFISGVVSVHDAGPMLSEDLIGSDASPEQKVLYFGLYASMIVALGVFAYRNRGSVLRFEHQDKAAGDVSINQKNNTNIKGHPSTKRKLVFV